MFCQAHQFKQGHDLFAGFIFRRIHEFEWQRDVVVDRAGGQQVEVLKDHAYLSAFGSEFRVRHLSEVFAVNDDFALSRAVQKVDAADKRAFAGTASADNSENVARPDMDVYVFTGVKRAFSIAGFIFLRDVL